MSEHPYLLLGWEEEDVTVDTICPCLGVSCNHGKEIFLGFCCAEQDTLQGMCHDEVLRKREKEKTREGRKGREGREGKRRDREGGGMSCSFLL